MDPALWLALGLIMFVLSNSCVGISWNSSLLIAFGTTIAIWIAHYVPKHRKDATGNDFKQVGVQTAWRLRTPRAKSLNVSKI